MKTETIMEIKTVSLYISKEPVEVENPIPLPEHSHDDMITSFQCLVNMKTSCKILRCMTKIDREHSRYMKQLIAFRSQQKHQEVVFRCLLYGNKIPRKYKRMYKEVIKRIPSQKLKKVNTM